MVQNNPTVLMADDHVLVAEGIGKLLEGNFELIGKVGDGFALVEAARELKPDLILADITLPGLGGLDAARQILRDFPDAKIVFITQHTEPQYVREALRIGALGYVVKQSASSELITALQDALAGRTYISPVIPQESLVGSDADPLTPRQREVLRLVAEGLSAKQIAGILNISTKTVEFHKAAVMERLGVRSTAQLTRYAVDHRLVG
jgi:DNA-binding NarL/FixJ family response regulator